MAGKPFAPIYDLCLTRVGELLGAPLDRGRVLVIGDGIATDLMGAQNQGLDALFIASGIHGADAIAGGGLDMAAVEALLAAEGASAAFAMADLCW